MPPLTALQFAVLERLCSSEKSGLVLREYLHSIGGKSSLPAFYQLMRRLEEWESVTSRSETIRTEGRTINKKIYSITENGKLAVSETREFYTRNSAALGTMLSFT